MSQCERCDAFDEDHAEHLDYPEGLSEEEEIEWLENHEDYEPSLYFYWHGDIQEDYDMGEYTCHVSLVSEHFLIKVKSKLPKIEIGIVKYMAGEILMVGIMSPLNCTFSKN